MGSNPSIPPKKNSRGKIIDVAEVNQCRWLEESGQWLENQRDAERGHYVNWSTDNLATGSILLNTTTRPLFWPWPR